MGVVDGAYAESVVERMREMLKKRGAEGLRGLARNFKICDTDGSGCLSLSEFSKCCSLCKLGLSQSELATLHDYFDADDEGLISFDEFIRAVRGRMSAVRKNLVIKCFNALDSAGDGNGLLSIEDIAPLFNTEEHPDVKEGKKTHDDVLREFLQSLEGNKGDGNGTVTLDEWIAYYEELSSSIDEDDYFGEMLEETWLALKSKGPDGEETQAILYVSEGDVNVLERILKKNIYQKSRGVNMEKTLKDAFKQFDLDGSGEVSIREFTLAMERFGLSIERPNSRGTGGVPLSVLRALFDRYNADQSECLSVQEFIGGLFAEEQQAKREHPVAAVGANPWLPSLEGAVTTDKNYVERPDSAMRVRPGVTPLSHMPRNPRVFESKSTGVFQR